MRTFLTSHRRLVFGGSVVIVLIVAASAAYYYRYVHVPEGAESFRPQYDLVLKDYDGHDIELDDYKRKLLVVFAWASWCPYCDEEIENLATLKQEFGERIQILAVNRAEPLEDAKVFSDRLNAAGIELMLDPDDSLYKQIGGYAMPETIFIDDSGEIVFHQRGPMKMDDVRVRIQELISE